MSIHSEDRDSDKSLSPKNKKKYVRIWRLEASKEFIIFMSVIVFAITTSVYNPIEIRKVADQLVDLGEQNNQTNIQSLNNTERIIDYFDLANKNDTATGLDIIKVLFLYMQDEQRDSAKIMDALNISNTHFVHVNGTHVITEEGIVELPYTIDLDAFPFNSTSNDTAQLEYIKN